MPAPDRRNAPSASSREVHHFLDFADGLGLDVELGGGVVRPRPGGLCVVLYGAEGDVVGALVERGGDGGVHRMMMR